jgi:hypothetical protein
MLDVCLRRQLIAVEDHDRGKQLLDRIVAMLVKHAALCAMADRHGRPAPHPHPHPHPNLHAPSGGPGAGAGAGAGQFLDTS